MTCPHCGEAFTPHRWGQCYCGADCQARHARAVYQRRHPDKMNAWRKKSRAKRRQEADRV